MIVRRLAFVVLAGCGAAHDAPSAGSDCPPEPVLVAPTARPVPATPAVRLLVRGDIVDGNGAIVGSVAGIDRRYAAHPVGPDQYSVGRAVVDATTGHTTPLPAIYDPGEGAYAIAGTFVAAPLHGGLELVDLATGKARWHVAASPRSLVIAGDELETTECSPEGDLQWTVSYALSDGRVRAKTPALSGCTGRVVSEVGHVIETAENRSMVYDLHGKALFSVARPVLKLAALGADLVVVTDQFAERVSPTGEVRWKAELRETFANRAELVVLPDGDLVVTLHSDMADTGIGIWRLRASGDLPPPPDAVLPYVMPPDPALRHPVVWRTWVPSLGIAHSRYRHDAYTAIRGDKLFAISQGSGGDFFERIDLASGARELRCQPLGVCGAPTTLVADPGFVIGPNLVAPDGHVVHTLDGVSPYAIAMPLGNHVFAIDGSAVDTANDTMVKAPRGIALVRDDTRPGDDHNAVVAQDSDGSIRWRQPFDGVRSVRPPDLAEGGGVVIAAVVGMLRAYDRTTGKVRWSAATDADELRVVDDTAYYVDCGSTDHHWLYGRAITDGTVRFRAALVTGCDPALIVDSRHEIAVERGSAGISIVFDRAGHELYRLHEEIASIYPIGGGLIVVSDKQIARIADSGKVVWTLGTPANTFVSANEIVELPDGDLVIANWCAISDDGVELTRVRASDGEVRWKAHVPGLGVGHSEYEQFVYLEVRANSLYVVSQASGGRFMEQLMLDSGARLTRHLL